ncbi:MAG: hypothetical protein J6M23_06640 [Bacteroidales bacterium]|nr:hypothetical protein [Bacteroidales bacterium]
MRRKHSFLSGTTPGRGLSAFLDGINGDRRCGQIELLVGTCHFNVDGEPEKSAGEGASRTALLDGRVGSRYGYA